MISLQMAPGAAQLQSDPCKSKPSPRLVSFGFWPLVLHCLHFSGFNSSIHQSHTKRLFPLFFVPPPHFHQAECQCFPFLRRLSPLIPPLAFQFAKEKAVYLCRQDLFFPSFSLLVTRCRRSLKEKKRGGGIQRLEDKRAKKSKKKQQKKD